MSGQRSQKPRRAAAEEGAGRREPRRRSSRPSRRPGSETVLLVAAAVAFQAIVWAFLIWLLRANGPWYHFFDVSDIVVYFDYAQKVAAGLRVYKDFSVRVPAARAAAVHAAAARRPGLVPELVRRRDDRAVLGGGRAHRRHGRGALARPRAAAGRGRRLRASPCSPPAPSPPTATTWRWRSRWPPACSSSPAATPPAAGAALGVGVALKLTPGMLLPLVLIVAETRRRVALRLRRLPRLHGPSRSCRSSAASTGSPTSSPTTPSRPLQIESVPGTPYLIAGALGKWGIDTGNSFGSQSLGGPGSAVVAKLSVWVGLLLVAGVYVLIWRRRALLRAAPEYIPVAALACVLAFTVCNKVLSPQYMCWTFPLVALVVVGRSHVPAPDRHPDAGRDRADPGGVPEPVLADGRPRGRPVSGGRGAQRRARRGGGHRRDRRVEAAGVAAAAEGGARSRSGGPRPPSRPQPELSGPDRSRRRQPPQPAPRRGGGFGAARASRIMTDGLAAARPALRRRAAVLPTAPG